MRPTRPLVRRGRRRGAVAVQVAVCLTIILGVVAIALDGGVLLHQRRHAQATADAAALAGAVELYQNWTANQGLDACGCVADSARTTAAANGFPNSGSTTVTVRVPGQVPVKPCAPPITDDLGRLNPGYVEVVVERRQQRFFSRLFGAGNLPIHARAVAQGTTTPATAPGIVLLEPTAQYPLRVLGNGELRVPACSVIVNSTHNQTFEHSGSGLVTAAEWDLSGSPGYVTTGGGTISGPVYTGLAPTPDPLRHLPAPSQDSLTERSTQLKSITGGVEVLLPGIYRRGLTISGGIVTMTSGIYYIDGGGFQVSGDATLTGNGVMIYNADGGEDAEPASVQIGGDASVTLNPLTSGTYAGMTIFQQRTVNLPLDISSNGNTDITGAVYAANAQVRLWGNGDGGDYLGSQYICRTMQVSGEQNVRLDIHLLTPRPKLRIIRLVE